MTNEGESDVTMIDGVEPDTAAGGEERTTAEECEFKASVVCETISSDLAVPESSEPEEDHWVSDVEPECDEVGLVNDVGTNVSVECVKFGATSGWSLRPLLEDVVVTALTIGCTPGWVAGAMTCEGGGIDEELAITEGICKIEELSVTDTPDEGAEPFCSDLGVVDM